MLFCDNGTHVPDHTVSEFRKQQRESSLWVRVCLYSYLPIISVDIDIVMSLCFRIPLSSDVTVHHWATSIWHFRGTASFYSKTNEMHQFLKFILFCSSTLHVSDGLSAHHQESKTVHTAPGVCQTDSADCLLAETRCSISFPLASSQQDLFDIYLMLYVQS